MMISVSKDYFNSPSVGVIENNKATTPANQLRLLAFQGKTFSFSYPNYFKPIQSSSVDGSDIEKYAFANTKTTTWNLNIKITTLSQASLSYDGSYNFRKTNPRTYSEEIVTLGGNEAHILSSNEGGYNKVVFLINGKLDADIALNSSSSKDNSSMDAALNEIIASWKWL